MRILTSFRPSKSNPLPTFIPPHHEAPTTNVAAQSGTAQCTQHTHHSKHRAHHITNDLHAASMALFRNTHSHSLTSNLDRHPVKQACPPYCTLHHPTTYLPSNVFAPHSPLMPSECQKHVKPTTCTAQNANPQ
ncbi:hypothetical protein C5H23_06785 [Xylella fastidiosa]|nr:hypothetical protein XfCFBP8078_00950 [Xylella fastidiosa subsp. multiplex]TNV89458.1 hypothetical protein C5H23_06785 [Xylella fastidiosa]TNV96548.1 hypothetical protein C5H22_04025 [Xylella fastidiosa]TNV98931.1 hypothetical protein C5H21_05870 [Xylella fastidiosa]